MQSYIKAHRMKPLRTLGSKAKGYSFLRQGRGGEGGGGVSTFVHTYLYTNLVNLEIVC